jgi:molybdenum cofactor cytidylyltransferase
VQGTSVVFAASIFGELRTLEGDAGARAVVRRDPRRVSTLAVDADMPFDVDTPDDYARLRGEGRKRTWHYYNGRGSVTD